MEKLLRPDKFNEDPSSSQATAAWRYWKKTFENFVRAAKVEDDQKLDVLTNFVGLTVYEIISEVTTYNEAISILTNIFDKPKNTIFSRYMLATSKQEPDESLDQFFQKLKVLAKDCGFTAVTAEQYKNNSIRDAFISGLSSSSIRQRLLEKNELDLQTAYDNARSLEMAEKQNLAYKPIYTAASVAVDELPDKVRNVNLEEASTSASASGTSSFQTQSKCYFCGLSRHPRVSCPAKDAICKNCGKKGHFARVCISKKSGTAAAVPDPFHQIAVLATTSGGLSRATIMVKLNTVKTEVLVDTGSTESFISEAVVKKRKLPVIPLSSKISMATGDLIKETKGYVVADLEFNGSVYNNIKLSVLPNLCTQVILGHDFLGLHKKLEMPFDGNRSPLSLCNLAAAKITPPTLFGDLSEGWKPIATKSRRHNHSDSLFIDNEVQRLLKEDIIEPCQSPWRAQVLVTSPEGHKKRMVIDYSQTINKFTPLDAYPQKKVDELVEKVSQYTYYSTLDLKSAYHQVPIKEEEKQFTAFEASGNLYQFKRIPFGVTNGVACFQRVIDEIIKNENLQATFAYVDNLTVCGVTKEEHDSNLEKFLKAAEKYNLTFNEDKTIMSTTKISLLGFEVSKGQIKPDPDRLKPLKELKPPHDKKSQERLVGMFAYYSQWISKFSHKAYPLIHNEVFPLSEPVLECFEMLKKELERAVLVTFDPSQPMSLVVETDASDLALAATLNQNGRPLAFFTRTLKESEKHQPPVEREACAVIEALRKWKHFLIGTHFTLVTDNEPIAFMYGSHSKKIKNDKILRWRLELSDYNFDSVYRPGPQNRAADALSRCSAVYSSDHLFQLHNALCHPGVSRLMHFVRSKNLPFSLEDVKRVNSQCKACAEVRPRYYKPSGASLIKATQAFERISVDFKGPLPSVSKNKYLLTVIDEYSRFPFAFPCPDMTASTVIKCYTQLFSMFGTPSFVHSDRGPSFMSREVKVFLQEKGIASSRTTPYNPQCNGQVERLNDTLWKAIFL